MQRNQAQCVATYAFQGSQITGQALIILGDPAPYAVAIAGGSDKYRRSRVRYGPPRHSNATEGILTFHLTDGSVPQRAAMKGPETVRPFRPTASASPACYRLFRAGT